MFDIDYQFLNSGLFAGSLAALHPVISAALARGIERNAADDQEVMGDLYTRKFTSQFKLDSAQACFGSAHLPSIPETSPSIWKFENGRWTNTKTGGRPALLHHNGGGKEWQHTSMRSHPAADMSWHDEALTKLNPEVLLVGADARNSTRRPLVGPNGLCSE